MKNKLNILSILIVATLLTACGMLKKTTSSQPDNNPTGQTVQGDNSDPFDAIVSTLQGWQTLQTGGNISLKGGSNFSSSIQMRMIRNEAIYISIRPMLGIEVGKLLITADSVFAVDKVHKRFAASKLSILTSGIPATVSDLQDIFLGRPFVLGKGTLNNSHESEVMTTSNGNTTVLSSKELYKNYSYSFTFDKSNHITLLNIVPAGSTTPAYQVKYSNVKQTTAGNIAHGINVDATIEQKKMSFSLSYKDIEWNKEVKIDRSIPGGYKRMDAGSLFNLFSN